MRLRRADDHLSATSTICDLNSSLYISIVKLLFVIDVYSILDALYCVRFAFCCMYSIEIIFTLLRILGLNNIVYNVYSYAEVSYITTPFCKQSLS